MSDFDERSGFVSVDTPWGRWWQTIEEICIEVNVLERTNAKEIKVDFKTKELKVTVKGNILIEGELCGSVHADDAIWTLEDKKLLRICLPKTDCTAKNVWPSLLKGQYAADPFRYDQMQQKMTLQRYQMENPGMDFSGATISGDYQSGGPDLPS